MTRQNLVRSSAVLAIAAGSILAAPAHAEGREDREGPYIAFSVGAVFADDSVSQGTLSEAIDFAPVLVIPANTDVGLTTEFDTGVTFTGAAGYDFGNGFRFEVEGFYTRYDVDTHSDITLDGGSILDANSAILLGGALDPNNPTIGEVIADGQGSITSYGAFANMYYEFYEGPNFRPYVGIGLGYAGYDIDFSPSGTVIADGSDDGFAYQAMAGATIQLTDKAELFAQYTYRDDLDDVNVDLDVVPGDLVVETTQHIVSGGLRVRLGK